MVERFDSTSTESLSTLSIRYTVFSGLLVTNIMMYIMVSRPSLFTTRVTRMAYSPSLWLMANWLVKQNQPVSKIETKSDTNLRSLYES